MQHATGLFKKIGRLNNPEEIQKWRDERKKKYPTKANVEKKQAEMKEKEKRGERMGLTQRKKNIVNKKGRQRESSNKILHPLLFCFRECMLSSLPTTFTFAVTLSHCPTIGPNILRLVYKI